MGVVLVIFLYNIFWLLKKKMNLENDSKSQSKRDRNSNTMPGVASLLEWMNMAADLANSYFFQKNGFLFPQNEYHHRLANFLSRSR